MKDLKKYFIDLIKCSEEQQKHIFSLLPEPVKKGDYKIDSENYFLHFNNGFSYPRWYVDFEYYNKTELTYPEFIKLFEDGEEEIPDPTAQLKADKEEMVRMLERCENRILPTENHSSLLRDLNELIQKMKQ